MEILFIGAAETVTGSKFLVKANGSKVLVDCGLYQGYKHLRRRNWAPLPFEVEDLDAVLLTHAHIDHSGYLPRLIKQGYEGPIYCTPATERLCQILLPDSGRIQQEDANFANKKGFSSHDPAQPLYTEDDAHEVLKLFEPQAYKTSFDAGGIKATYAEAGHILGAALLEVNDGEENLLFSGDLGRLEDPLMNPPEMSIEPPDYLVMESTYGNRQHGSTDPKEQLKKLINQTVERGGTVLIPSFAVGRAQTLSYFLQQLMEEEAIPEVPVYLDSPMAVRVSKIFNSNPELHRLNADECTDLDAAITYTNSVEQSKAINRRTDPCVIISASGMATGGRVLHHLKVYGPDERNLILFAGYQAPGTRGDKIMSGAKAVKIHGGYVPIRARVNMLENLSAHADYNEMLEWMEKLGGQPDMTFLVHGSPESTDAFRLRIEDKLGWDCRVPEYLGRAQLSNGEVNYITPAVPRIHS